MSCYFLGRLGKWSWLTRYFKIEKSSIEAHKLKLDRFGLWPSFFCWLPIIGDPLAVYYGFMRSSILTFSLFMGFGKLLRYIFILYIVDL
ncbi:YqaA family protein [Halobacteriovorax marinus]|uniref:hypothetical protein n=1 Tax=Halobacteriovorax marinus TaxID=97084 RepID=UPI000BDEE07F|nr:hypothetical protein [Halobacteriovorax marinus]